MSKPFLSSREASNMIGCSISTLDRYETNELLAPAMRVGVKRYYSSNEVEDFIINRCRGSKESCIEGVTFLSASDVRRKLSISVTMLNELESKGILIPCRRLPLNGKRLYLESDVEAMLNR